MQDGDGDRHALRTQGASQPDAGNGGQVAIGMSFLILRPILREGDGEGVIWGCVILNGFRLRLIDRNSGEASRRGGKQQAENQ